MRSVVGQYPIWIHVPVRQDGNSAIHIIKNYYHGKKQVRFDQAPRRSSVHTR